MARRRMKQGWKKGNTRHRVQVASSADSQDRAIERTERQEARRELDAELAEIEAEPSQPDRSRELRIVTAGVSYMPIPEVALKFDYVHTSQADGDRVDQVNLGVAYMF